MFRVDTTLIIRSTKLYLQHLVFAKPLLLSAAVVEDFRLQFERFHGNSNGFDKYQML